MSAPSTISISPFTGQLGPFVQKAGQVPHPVGMCTESMITRPPVNVNWVVMRTLWRVFWTWGVVSTFIMAFPALLIDARLACFCVDGRFISEKRQKTRK